jgi:putative oxidoreductase
MVLPPFIKYGSGPLELIIGICLMVGLFTGWAAFLGSGLCAVAYWTVYGRRAFLPMVNGGELLVSLCFAALFISSKGASIWSLDRLLGHRASKY